MKKIRFSSVSDGEAYRCSEPNDQSGEYYKAEEVEERLSLIAAVIEEIRKLDSSCGRTHQI